MESSAVTCVRLFPRLEPSAKPRLFEIWTAEVTLILILHFTVWDGFHNNLDGMVSPCSAVDHPNSWLISLSPQVVVENPGRERFKMYVPDIKAFFESHAEKPGDTMICTGKLVRNKPMYR